ncbi:hypothetical protein [Bacillus sp. KH172YL63]|uniref:hypothetical protein n=1 Tax=Bacillus sp. KH172YL63 TaxID=2709784 RepID=UPI0013E4D96C|nr:hypothetical protein [Bacillus sp. KH172YL63]BCB04491.1 hypothetical protein KH172YL63_26240 [Bacillus sp. KH172YL63]
MLPKQDIMLKLAEIEESLNQLEQNLHDRISVEEKDGCKALEEGIFKMDCQLSALEKNTAAIKGPVRHREKTFALQKLELSYKTS